MSITAMRQALKALENHDGNYKQSKDQAKRQDDAVAALRQAIAEAEQQDVVLPGGGHVPAVPVAVYGYCPECGCEGVMRERHPFGNDKCTNGHRYPSSQALSKKPEQAEQAQPVAWTVAGKVTDWSRDFGAYKTQLYVRPVYLAPPQRQPLTVEQAYDMGAKGGEPTESERLLFEAWMRGHCWKVCGTWDGKQYRSPTEVNGEVDYHAMHTRQLWAAWRDRAALEAAHRIRRDDAA